MFRQVYNDEKPVRGGAKIDFRDYLAQSFSIFAS